MTVMDLGTMPYGEAWDLQERLHQQLVDRQMAGQPPEQHYFLFVEHPHVYTLGKSGHLHNLLADNQQLKARGIEFFKTNRGGDITYHGPGQIVGYPILDLHAFRKDIRWYMRTLEQVIIDTLADWDITAGRVEGMTGVWVDIERPHRARKICAMGVRISRWVTMHGFALNVNTNLDYFQMIIPCGIANKEVTSMQRELGKPIDMEAVKRRLLHHFERNFGVEARTGTQENLRTSGPLSAS